MVGEPPYECIIVFVLLALITGDALGIFAGCRNNENDSARN